MAFLSLRLFRRSRINTVSLINVKLLSTPNNNSSLETDVDRTPVTKLDKNRAIEGKERLEILKDDYVDNSDDLNDDNSDRPHSYRNNFRPAERLTKASLQLELPLKTKTFTLAPLINRSKTLQNLVELGVDLHQLEPHYNATDYLMRLNWEKDILPRLQFLITHACVEKSMLGSYITKNPWILQQDLYDLQTRVNYLESKGFSKAAVARIVTRAVYWLNLTVPTVDQRFVWFKDEFQLNDDELRFIITKHPKLVTFGTGYIQYLQFSFEEEMGFSKKQTKILMLKDPKLWTSYRNVVWKTFDYLHNKLGWSHELILSYPRALRVYVRHVKERHEFLKSRHLAQYDPEKPNFVPLYTLVGGTDDDFCRNVAKCSVKEYNSFLKTQ